jgi:hypothetical protein
MILDRDREPLDGRVERGALRHGPRLQHLIDLETEVVMKLGGPVLLDDEEVARPRRLASRRGLEGLAEGPLLPVLLECLHPAAPIRIHGSATAVVSRRSLAGRGARTDVIARFIRELGTEKLMFEAADPEVFAWYVKNYGPEVNLFVDHSQIVQLEALRSGIWGKKSLWGRVLTNKP